MPAPRNLLVQTAAKSVLSQLVDPIKPDLTESSTAKIAADQLRQSGFPDTWYYDCPAFVLLGSRSSISVSGRDYQPSSEKVGLNNLVTVDLSPRSGNDWGDCARSFYVENGVCRSVPLGDEFTRGYEAERSLHALMLSSASAASSGLPREACLSAWTGQSKHLSAINRFALTHSSLGS
jgi:hypothetical protein